MASPIRPQENTENARILTAVIKSGESATVGLPLKRNTDGTIETAAAGERVCGWPVCAGVAGETIGYYVPDGSTVLAVKVGTGGATPGKYAVVVADGVTNEPTLGGGTTAVELCGEFVDEGVVGDLAGLRIFSMVGVKA